MISNCYIIAEIGLNHNGSIDLAKQLIDVAKNCGVDAVKFQKRTVDSLAVDSTLNAKDDRFPDFGKTYKEIRNYLEFNLDEYLDLKQYTKSKNLDFIVTAFDIEAVDFLEMISVDKYKIASHSVTNLGLLKYLALKNKPVIMSTGMCEIEDIDTAVNIFNDCKVDLTLLHCVSAYPTPLDECNLLSLKKLKNRYNLATGYSGHEIGFIPSLIAVAMGAEVLERHITLDKNMVGFDHKISLDPSELELMVSQIRSIPKIIGTGEKFITDKELITKNKYHVSMVSSRKIKKGELLQELDVTYKNPGNGIPPKSANLILGKKALYDILPDQILSFDMFQT